MIKDKIYYICHLKEDLFRYPENKTIVLTPINKLQNNHYLLPIYENDLQNIASENINKVFS